MRIYALADLPATVRSQLVVPGVMTGDPPRDEEQIRRLRAFGFPLAPYYAVYAVAGGEVLSRVEVIRPTFRTIEGLQVVSGISDVATRPDAVDRGYARALIREVHRREQRAGRRWCLLWTQRSWGAHRLYERLGYRDVYSPPTAVRYLRASPPTRLPRGYAWETAGPGDFPRLERLLRRGTEGRVGFVSRFPGSYRARVRLGWRTLANFRILLEGSEDAGFAYVTLSSTQAEAIEVLVASPSHRRPMLDALETLAKGRWLVLRTTSFAADVRDELGRRGYGLYAPAHLVLMARRLRGTASDADDVAATCRDVRFSCHRGDVF